MTQKSLLIIGSIFMALAVGFGAFGAHIVQDMLTPDRFEVYKTAVEYHFYHAIGLLILGAVSMQIEESKWLKWSGYCLIGGILIFSGSLYILTLTDTGWLGRITPLGGFAFILGWIFFAIGIICTPDSLSDME
jgi:uncharacterized membrane protein YgdD (TMEM256/DUF423 family)